MNTLWIERYATHNAYESFEQSLQVIAKSCHAKTFGDIETVLDMLADILDIRSAAILIIERDDETKPVLVDTLRFGAPDEWLNYYIDRNLVRFDPVVKHALRSDCALAWNNNLLDTLSSAQYSQFPGWVRSFDICGGLIYPFPRLPGEAQEFIFYAPTGDNDEDPTSSYNLHQIGMLLQYPSDAIRRIYRETRLESTRHPLTNRELQVLNWASLGKTSSEIALILSISERTVKFHLSNTYEKLGVINRQQAIAKAIHNRFFETK